MSGLSDTAGLATGSGLSQRPGLSPGSGLSPSPTPPPSAGFITLEDDSGFILLESGDYILLEG